jgi:uncharacterized protein (TIGR02001 family)
MTRISTGILTAALAAAFSSAAMAADSAPDKVQTAIDLAFGAAITNNYLARGITQSNNKPAFQAYMEASYGIAYAGVWGSNVDFGTGTQAEIDLYGGIRPVFGKLSMDIGYARYLYTKDGNCCGDGYVKASFAATDKLSVGGEIYNNFQGATYVKAKASFALPQEFAVSGAFGTYTSGPNRDWDIGVSKAFGSGFKLDLRYYGFTDNVTPTNKFVAALTFDTTLSALTGK